MTFVHELPKKMKFLVRNNPYSQQNGQCTFDMGLVDGYNEVATVYYNYQLRFTLDLFQSQRWQNLIYGGNSSFIHSYISTVTRV